MDQQTQYTAPQSFVPAPPKPKRQYSVPQKLLAISMAVFGYLYIRAFFFGMTEVFLGKTLFVFLLLAVSAVYMVRCRIRPNAASITAGVLTAVFSLSFTINGQTGLPAFLTAVFCQLSYTYFVYKAFDTTVERAPGKLFGFDLIKAVFVMPFASFGSLFPAIFSSHGVKNKKAAKTIGFILIGLIVSVFPTAVVASLLSYDSNFMELFDRFFSFEGIRKLEIGFHLFTLLLGLPVAMYIFGLWSSGAFGAAGEMNRTSCTAARDKARVFPRALVFAAVTPVLFVYVLFFVSQFAYFTSSFTGVLPAGYSYAEYARRGFFELCAVMVINGFLVLALYLFVKRGGKTGLLKLYATLISAATLILAATAFSKMLLYVDAYGLTLSRVYTLGFMLAMAVVFILLLVRIYVPKFKFIPLALAVLIIVFGALTLSDVPALVSHYNTERVLAGENWVLDKEYFRQLGDAAVEDAIRIERDERIETRMKLGARAYLDSVQRNKHDQREYSLFKFNLPRMRAERALKDREKPKSV